jgi:hypothetical protein
MKDDIKSTKNVENNVKELGPTIGLDTSPDIHKSYPCDFFQNHELCDYAIRLGGYLHSLPPTWVPRPVHVKKVFGWGKKKWDQACHDLIEWGYMKIHAGGKNGGSSLKFSMYKKFPGKAKVSIIHKRESLKATVAKSDCPQKSPLRYKNICKRENIKEEEQQHRDDDLDFLLKKGVFKKKAKEILKAHGFDKCKRALEIGMARAIENPVAYAIALLDRNAPLELKKGPSSQYPVPTPEESKTNLKPNRRSTAQPKEFKDLVRKLKGSKSEDD